MVRRIIAVVDALDALASPREYREAAAARTSYRRENHGRERTLSIRPKLVDLIRRNWRSWEVKVKEDLGGGFIESIVAAQREAKILFALAQKLGNSLDPADSFEAVKIALDVLVPYGGMALWIEHEGALRMNHFAGAPLEAWKLATLPMGEGASGQAALTGALVTNGDAVRDLDPAGGDPSQTDRRPFRYAMAAPLSAAAVADPHVVRGGRIRIHAGARAHLGGHRSHAGGGHRQRHALPRSQRPRGADSLTGLPNASALAARLAALEGPCAVVVCDLDRFKQLNDRFGHPGRKSCAQRSSPWFPRVLPRQGFRRTHGRERICAAALGGA